MVLSKGLITPNTRNDLGKGGCRHRAKSVIPIVVVRVVRKGRGRKGFRGGRMIYRIIIGRMKMMTTVGCIPHTVLRVSGRNVMMGSWYIGCRCDEMMIIFGKYRRSRRVWMLADTVRHMYP